MMNNLSISRGNNSLSRFYNARKWKYLSSYDQELLVQVYEKGGFYNAHAHLDRAYTLEDRFLSHIGTTPLEASNLPLSVKQNLVGDFHLGLAYSEENLRERMSHAIEMQIAYGVRKIDTCIDATPDISEDGLLAIRIALELKEKYKEKIAIRIAPNPIFGFKAGTRRWEIFKKAAHLCDFISLLPEKDDYRGLTHRDGKVGFKTHIHMGLELACKLNKEVHLHLDQANKPDENGTETLIEGLGWLSKPQGKNGESMVKVIHMISPSAYPEGRFGRLIENLLEYNIGVIVCPTAAISMRQLRSLDAPLHNSIARVSELIKMKVPVWIGTDNICDVFVPQGDGDMLTEVKFGGHAVRIATPSIWAKVASGLTLNAVDIATVGRVLFEDRKACVSAGQSGWKPCIE